MRLVTQDVNYYVLKNNEVKLNNRIKQVVVEIKNMMIKLKTGSDRDNVKHNKHHKCTLDEALTSSFEIQR